MILLGNLINALAFILKISLNIYFWIVIGAVILTWVRANPYGGVARALTTLTDPVFYRIRKWLPFTYTNGLDFSPIVVLVVLEILDMVVVKTLLEWAALLR